MQAQPDDAEILPQFPVGEYLKQLDPTYDHPNWRVDFLITYRTERHPVYIIVEYDDFEFHFKDGAQVHVGNHERYLLPVDVERQLTLESYGYRFLRINRFNLGKDLVAALDERLAKLVELATGEQSTSILERLRAQAEGMVKKDMRQCTRCEQINRCRAFSTAACAPARAATAGCASNARGRTRIARRSCRPSIRAGRVGPAHGRNARTPLSGACSDQKGSRWVPYSWAF